MTPPPSAMRQARRSSPAVIMARVTDSRATKDFDFSPAGTGNTDGVRDDFKEKFLMVNRVSNLLTLRSDMFTAYILVQGWRNAGSIDPLHPPTLDGQRRLAVIIDRSRITAVKKTPAVYNVPTAN